MSTEGSNARDEINAREGSRARDGSKPGRGGSPREGSKASRLQAALACAVIVLLGAAVAVISFRNSDGNIIRFRAIKAAIDKGGYTFSAPGVILLAKSDRPLTFDGFVYVTGEPAELILFPRWRGTGASLVATGWSIKPLNVGDDVNARIPYAFDSAEAGGLSAVPPTGVETVRVAKSLGENWYMFERRAN